MIIVRRKKINIFYLDSDVKLCAQYHVDRHTVKMILEYSQLLSTAHRILDGKLEEGKKMVAGSFPVRWRKFTTYKLSSSNMDELLYSATHVNHPSAIWVRQGFENYMWLHSLLVELSKEYTFRYGKVHKCQSSGLIEALSYAPFNIPTKGWTEPTPAMPDDVKLSDSVSSYRNYYIRNKQHLASWKNRESPKWYKQGCLKLMSENASELGLTY